MPTTENTEGTEFLNKEVTQAVIASAICVHKELGPGLLESVYERCLAYELRKQGHVVEVQKAVPIISDNIKFEIGFRADLVVDNKVLIEVKAIRPTASDSPCSGDHISEAHRIADRPPSQLQRPNA